MQVDITEIDSKNREEYEGKLLEALQSMREDYEHQITLLRQETETLYSSKVRTKTMEIFFYSSRIRTKTIGRSSIFICFFTLAKKGLKFFT